MKTSTIIKKAWMDGWDSANSNYTEWTRDLAWKGSKVYRQYLKALEREDNLKDNHGEY